MDTSISATAARRIQLGLTILRVVVGLVFVMHGGQKLFVYGLGGVTGSFAQMGIPLAPLVAPATALIEFLGGVALILGLLTPVAGALLAVVMLGAVVTVHLPGGFFLPEGIEYALTLMAASAALALAGPGAFSVDGVLAQRRAAR